MSAQFLFDINTREERLALLHPAAGRQHAEAGRALKAAQRRIAHTQLLKDARGRAGHGGRDEDGHDADALAQHVHHGFQPFPALLGLGQHPGHVLVDVAVALANQLPDILKRHGELQFIHVLLNAEGVPSARAMSRRSMSFHSPWAGTTPSKYFSTMATVRLTRLPRSLARSALMRVSRAS